MDSTMTALKAFGPKKKGEAPGTADPMASVQQARDMLEGALDGLDPADAETVQSCIDTIDADVLGAETTDEEIA